MKDFRGLPVARITYAPGKHEVAAQEFYLPRLVEILEAAGADVATAVPEVASASSPVAAGDVPSSYHVLGGMRMGADPTSERHRRDRTAPPARQPRRRRRLGVPDVRRPQPDADDHGHRAAQRPALGAGVLMAGEISRRSVVAGGSLLAAALALGIDLTACTSEDGDNGRDDKGRPGREGGRRRGYSVLTAHEAAVVIEATARLVPGPTDDPSESGTPRGPGGRRRALHRRRARRAA